MLIFSAYSVTSVAMLVFSFLCFGFVPAAFAVPETAGLRITDVTPSSFSVVWMTDVAAAPSIEVYTDSSMVNRLTDGLVVTPMPAGSDAIVQAARNKGIMKVKITGLNAASKYYARAVTGEIANPQNVGYSALYEVITASGAAPYHYANGPAQGFSNDLLVFKTYIRPSDMTGPESGFPGLGDLIILESDNSAYPLSSFVGDWIDSPEGLIDLNNLFGTDGMSLNVKGGEKIALTIFRSGGLSTLVHYRRSPVNSEMVYA
ncbi:MAG: hypothetical protein HY880_09285, partial [Deltaproteobacteria bacterium]|nr:hypothetical protein [Deltaproteobacteria bacterium]